MQMTMMLSIVGTSHRKATALVNSFEDGEPITLIREADNAYDKNAVQVWARGQQVGFIARTEVIGLAFKMDQMKLKTYAGTFRHFKGLSVAIEIEE